MLHHFGKGITVQYNVKLTGTAPATDAIRQAVQAVDPWARVDIEPNGQSLRVASWMPSDPLATLISQAGHPLSESELERVPSECCGGCGG